VITKLAILVWSLSPERPELCAAPFVYAAAAAAMDCEVEIHFAGTAVKLLAPGAAQNMHPGAGRERSIYDFMRDAADQGAAFYGCQMALRTHGLADCPLIPEYSGAAGAAAFVARAVDPEWRTLVF
jgi:predicted peroxiredoxin